MYSRPNGFNPALLWVAIREYIILLFVSLSCNGTIDIELTRFFWSLKSFHCPSMVSVVKTLFF